MRKIYLFLCFITAAGIALGQAVPEVLYYKFDGTGTSVPNEASAPPAGTNPATIVGSQTQGSNGLCGGALIGTGASGNTDYVNTGWATNLNGSWTLSFWTNNVPSTTTLYYIFGDAGAGSFRCFTGGVAGAGNWILRGPVTDVLVTGGASTGPTMTTYVYDANVPEIRAYLDGVLVNTVAQTTLTNTSTGPFKIGGYSGSNGLPLNSLMDEFRWYNRALDSIEIQLTYNQCLPLTSAPDDAGVRSLVAPSSFCSDTLDIVVSVKNYGTAVLDSCWVNWDLNGAPQAPVQVIGPLDTVGGSGPNEVQVTLGSNFFASGTPYNLKTWTSLPNGVADTVNFNDTLQTTLQASLAGNFTIGGAGADYASFNAAASDLNMFGICGPVVFDVYDTLYNEQFTLNSITGSSTTNTIRFQAASGMPLVWYNGTGAGDNYVLNINGADYVTFDGLEFNNQGPTGFAQVLTVSGGAEYNTWQNCAFVGDTTPTSTSTNYAVIYSTNGLDNFNSFLSNTVRGGSYGAYWEGDGTTALEQGSVFEGNTFVDQYYMGSRLYYQDSSRFVGNTFYGTNPYTGTTYGFYFAYNDNSCVITHNRVSTGTVNPRYGMYFFACDGALGAENLVANNMVHVGQSASTSLFYGIYNSAVTYTRLYHNSVNMEGTSTTARAMYFNAGGNIELRNNSAQASNGYAGYFNSTTSISASDYNNWKSNGANLTYYNATSHPNLASHQTATGWDSSSVSVDPMYYSADNLHTCSDSLENMGTPLALVTDDYDGDMRDTLMPDIGADERQALMGGFLGADTTICSNDSVTYTVGQPGDSVTWSHGPVGNTVSLTTPGTYIAMIATPCGSVSDTVDVIASALSYQNFLVADTTMACDGDTIWLRTSMPFDSLQWSTGAGTDSIAVVAGGAYSVFASDACGSGMDTLTFSFFATPVAIFSAVDSGFSCIFTNTSGTGGGTNTYSWDFGDGNNSTMANPTHTYAANGSYPVTLTATNECGTSTFTDTCHVNAVGISEGLDFEVALYPNPATTELNLQANLPGSREIQLRLMTPLGQVLRVEDLGVQSGRLHHVLNLKDLAAGLYVLRIEADGMVSNLRFVRQ